MTAAAVYTELAQLLAAGVLPAPETVDLFIFEGAIDVRLSFPEGETHHVDAWALWAEVDVDAPKKPCQTGRGKNARVWRYYEFRNGMLGGHPLRVECTIGLPASVSR